MRSKGSCAPQLLINFDQFELQKLMKICDSIVLSSYIMA